MKKYIDIDVDEFEFFEKCIESGMIKEKAQWLLNICKKMGSSLIIGEEMLYLREQK